MSYLVENSNEPVLPQEMDRDKIRRLLLDAMRSLPEAQSFFEQHLENDGLLQALFDIALNDDTDTTRLQACFCISQFPAHLLRDNEDNLLKLQAEDWESISDAATAALAKIHSKKGLKYLIDHRITPVLPWEARMIYSNLEDFLLD